MVIPSFYTSKKSKLRMRRSEQTGLGAPWPGADRFSRWWSTFAQIRHVQNHSLGCSTGIREDFWISPKLSDWERRPSYHILDSKKATESYSMLIFWTTKDFYSNPPRAESSLVVFYRNPRGFLNIFKTEWLGAPPVLAHLQDTDWAKLTSEAFRFLEDSGRCWTPYKCGNASTEIFLSHKSIPQTISFSLFHPCLYRVSVCRLFPAPYVGVHDHA